MIVPEERLKQLAIRLGLTHHRCMNAYSEDLRGVAGLRVSESTVSRLLRRLGWSRKKDR